MRNPSPNVPAAGRTSRQRTSRQPARNPPKRPRRSRPANPLPRSLGWALLLRNPRRAPSPKTSRLPATMTDAPLISGYDALLSDLDGVVYAGPGAIAGAVEALERLPETGTALGYITNNASRSPEEVAAHLRSLGAPAAPGQVFGS